MMPLNTSSPTLPEAAAVPLSHTHPPVQVYTALGTSVLFTIFIIILANVLKFSCSCAAANLWHFFTLASKISLQSNFWRLNYVWVKMYISNVAVCASLTGFTVIFLFFPTDCYFGVLELQGSMFASKALSGRWWHCSKKCDPRTVCEYTWDELLLMLHPPVTIRGECLLQIFTANTQTGIVMVHTCLNHSFSVTE